MALPNRTARGAFRPLNRRRQKKAGVPGRGWAVGIVKIVSTVSVLLSLFRHAVSPRLFSSVSRDGSSATKRARKSASSDATAVPLTTLARETAFLGTLRSCLPQTDGRCKTYVPPGHSERIALVVPPGRIGSALARLLQRIVESAAASVELRRVSSVPPYGYGKTHGWTRIIRFVPTPLLVGVADTVDAELSSHVADADADSRDVDSLLRQHVRYHCRLSHVAAHTSLWTIRTDDLTESNADNFQRNAVQFLGLPQSSSGTHVNDSEVVTAFRQVRDIFTSLAASEGSRILARAANTSIVKVIPTLDTVMEREMAISKDLSAWPCQSFWTVGTPRHPLEISPMAQNVARALSPNCTATLTKCFVKRDICEAAGDGKCT